MGFYLRLAPGLRLGLTSRGLRASVGPRSARLHFGAGGTGVSTGAGPLTYYQPLSSGSTGRGRAAKLAQAQQVNAMWERLFAVHQQSFASAGPRTIDPPASPSLREFTREQARQARRQFPWWRLIRRLRAGMQARQLASHQWPSHVAQLQLHYEQAIEDEHRRWTNLIANDAPTVMAQLQEAFADNEMPAAPLGVEGAEAAVTVLAPPQEAIPERIGGITDAGNVSLRKLPKTERQSLMTSITCGYALVTAREAFAVAPALDSVRVVVLRSASEPSQTDPPSTPPELVCVLAGRWARENLESADWRNANALDLATHTADELIMNLRGKALQPIDLTNESDIQALLAAVDPRPTSQDGPVT